MNCMNSSVIIQPEEWFYLYICGFCSFQLHSQIYLAIINMEFITKFFGVLTQFFKLNKTDPLTMIPIEICEIIFRQLDPQTLLNVVRVSKKWMSLCRNDIILRAIVRHYLRKQKKNILNVTKLKKKTFNQSDCKYNKVRENVFQSKHTVSYSYNSFGIINSKKSLICLKNCNNNFYQQKHLLIRLR